MKILYSCMSRSWGGMEMFTITAVKQLLNRNIEVELLCFKDSKIHEEAVNKSIKVIPIQAKSYFHPIQSLKIARKINISKYDLIHTQASKDLWIIVPALNILNSKIPLLLTKQVGSFVIKKDWLHRKLYKRLNYAFAISTVIKNNLIETCPIDEKQIKLLFNAVDTKKFDPTKVDSKKVREEFRITDNEIVVGMLARFSPGKGHEEFILAAKKLVKIFTNLKFIIVGEPSRGENEYAAKIKSLVENSALSNNVIFTGFRSDTPNVLAAMDVFAFPSHSEAFGIALVEAMSVAKPTVCSNSDGVLDITVDGETGLLFEKQNENDLADKIQKLISAPALRKKMGLNARARAISKFDIEVLTDRVIDYYKEALDRK